MSAQQEDNKQSNPAVEKIEDGVPAENPGSEILENSKGGIPSTKENEWNSGEITNNDGSVIETLDTAFHGEPGMIKDHSIAGSNRADYYEVRSEGKSDSEEELDVLRDNQPD